MSLKIKMFQLLPVALFLLAGNVFAAEGPLCRYGDEVISGPDLTAFPEPTPARQFTAKPFSGAWRVLNQEYAGGPINIISGCSPEGLWRYEYSLIDFCGSYPFGLPAWVNDYKFCYFRLPRADNGNIVSGDVACRGESVTFANALGHIYCGLPDAHGFMALMLHFDRQRLEINGLPLEPAPDLECVWTSGTNTEPPCLWHQDCPEGKFCSWDKGCWDGCKTTGCENEGDLCIGHLNDCRACPLDCGENQICTFWNDMEYDIPVLEGIDCSGPCEPACDSSSWCDEKVSKCLECPGAPCREGSVCERATSSDDSHLSLLCQSYCDFEDCPDDAQLCYHSSNGISCDAIVGALVPAEGCNPACTEDFECMKKQVEGSNAFCANNCQSQGCPQGYKLCVSDNDRCTGIIPLLNL